MKKSKTGRLVVDAMLSAMVAVLGSVAVTSNVIKISFESLPILFAALCFGAVDAAIVGGIGTLIYQLLVYSVSPTTALWILPYVAGGLLAGLIGRGGNGSAPEGSVSRVRVLMACTLAELAITAFNTLAIYVDSRLYGYYYPTIITGMILVRIAVAIGEGLAFGAVLPALLSRVRIGANR